MPLRDRESSADAGLTGRVIAGRFRLERHLSRGGMGSVWLATHLELGATVAVKLMDPALAQTPEGRSRFAREARTAATIRSAHVVKILDYGVDAGAPYLVMELLEGEDLRERLHREERLSLVAAALVLRQIARGLRRAHEAGVVHRDLKPANIFLTTGEEDVSVKILDFGIAKVLAPPREHEHTETGLVMGSLHYLSPEQARGRRDVDHRADLWALGVLAYRMIAGALPFQGNEPGDVIVQICTEPPLPIEAALPEMSEETLSALSRFFERALARDPARRFSSAIELADAFGEIAGIRAAASATNTLSPGLGGAADATSREQQQAVSKRDAPTAQQTIQPSEDTALAADPAHDTTIPRPTPLFASPEEGHGSAPRAATRGVVSAKAVEPHGTSAFFTTETPHFAQRRSRALKRWALYGAVSALIGGLIAAFGSGAGEPEGARGASGSGPAAAVAEAPSTPMSPAVVPTSTQTVSSSATASPTASASAGHSASSPPAGRPDPVTGKPRTTADPNDRVKQRLGY